jgi:2-amino-4-hydroxy-6-hydroxymethyldihydropteridine diphosphokinase
MNGMDITKTAYIGIGSNLGDKLDNCLRAIDQIEKISGVRVTARSPFYRTEPVGIQRQDWYLNGAIALSLHISVRALLTSLLDIENVMGRKRIKKWDSRIIDLDILIAGDEVIDEQGLTVPHPLMHKRRFVLVPLVQLAPELMHPTLGMTIGALLARIPEEGQSVEPIRVV